MNKLITAFVIVAFIAVTMVALSPLTGAWAHLINSQADAASVAADNSNRLIGKPVDNQVAEIEIWQQYLLITIGAKVVLGFAFAMLLLLLIMLVYRAVIRKLFAVTTNPDKPLITIQTRIPEWESLKHLQESNDREFYQAINEIRQAVIGNMSMTAK